MSAGLRQSVADYLAVRRSLGFRLARPEKLLAQFAGYLEQAGAATVTTEHALAWAVLPGGDPALARLPARGRPRVRRLAAHHRPGRADPAGRADPGAQAARHPLPLCRR